MLTLIEASYTATQTCSESVHYHIVIQSPNALTLKLHSCIVSTKHTRTPHAPGLCAMVDNLSWNHDLTVGEYKMR